jgi:hypothetical protein
MTEMWMAFLSEAQWMTRLERIPPAAREWEESERAAALWEVSTREALVSALQNLAASIQRDKA